MSSELVAVYNRLKQMGNKRRCSLANVLEASGRPHYWVPIGLNTLIFMQNVAMTKRRMPNVVPLFKSAVEPERTGLCEQTYVTPWSMTFVPPTILSIPDLLYSSRSNPQKTVCLSIQYNRGAVCLMFENECAESD